MKNVTCLTTPTLVLGPTTQPQQKRSVVLQNQSSEIIYLCFFPTGSEVLSIGLGYQLPAGQTLSMSPSSPGGPDGSNQITALSASGTAILHEQHGDYTRTIP
jgi:hypothetical protein